MKKTILLLALTIVMGHSYGADMPENETTSIRFQRVYTIGGEPLPIIPLTRYDPWAFGIDASLLWPSPQLLDTADSLATNQTICIKENVDHGTTTYTISNANIAESFTLGMIIQLIDCVQQRNPQIAINCTNIRDTRFTSDIIDMLKKDVQNSFKECCMNYNTFIKASKNQSIIIDECELTDILDKRGHIETNIKVSRDPKDNRISCNAESVTTLEELTKLINPLKAIRASIVDIMNLNNQDIVRQFINFSLQDRSKTWNLIQCNISTDTFSQLMDCTQNNKQVMVIQCAVQDVDGVVSYDIEGDQLIYRPREKATYSEIDKTVKHLKTLKEGYHLFIIQAIKDEKIVNELIAKNDCGTWVLENCAVSNKIITKMFSLHRKGKNVPFLEHCTQLGTHALISLDPANNKVTYDSLEPIESLSNMDLGSIKTHISCMEQLGVRNIEIQLSDDNAVMLMISWLKKHFTKLDVNWVIRGTTLIPEAFLQAKGLKHCAFEECFIHSVKSKISYAPVSNGIVYIHEQNVDWKTCEADMDNILAYPITFDRIIFEGAINDDFMRNANQWLQAHELSGTVIKTDLDASLLKNPRKYSNLQQYNYCTCSAPLPSDIVFSLDTREQKPILYLEEFPLTRVAEINAILRQCFDEKGEPSCDIVIVTDSTEAALQKVITEPKSTARKSKRQRHK